MVSGVPRLRASRARAQKSGMATILVLAACWSARLTVFRLVVAEGIAGSGRYRHTACRRRFRHGELVLGDLQVEQPGTIQSQTVALGPFIQERQAGGLN